MAEKVLKCGITREKEFLYFVDKDGDISKTPMKHGRNKKVKKETMNK